jgi:hypothetical protein
MEDRMRVDQVPNSISQMPRYFFHLKRGQITILDQEGVALPDIDEAVKEAARRGREIARRGAPYGGVPSGAVVIVADEQWRPVLQVPIEDVVNG